jgi:uncharacterized protein YdeI (YjbR/CyaY-like superfamily)
MKTVAQFLMPDEFSRRSNEVPKFAEAFYALSLCRQKAYLLNFLMPNSPQLERPVLKRTSLR